MSIELFPHQAKAVKLMKNGTILCGGVGSGKSFTALEYFVRNEKGRKLYIITTAKKRDSLEWRKDCKTYGVEVEKVDSWNNIDKYKNIKGAFFIFDEQRVVGRGLWAKRFVKIAKNNHWIMLSATPGDTWRDYAAVFVARGFVKTFTEFDREYCIVTRWGGFPKIEGYRHVQRLEKWRDDVLVDMPFSRRTTRCERRIWCHFELSVYQEAFKKRVVPWTGEPMKNAAQLGYVLRRVCGTDKSRIDEFQKLWEKHPRLICFYNFDYELEILRETCGDVLKEWNGHKHEPVPEGDRWVYAVQYTSGSEGWNCIATDTIVFWSMPYSYKSFEQAKGRIDRLDTTFETLNYYIFCSNSSIESAIWATLKEKKNFNEWGFLSARLKHFGEDRFNFERPKNPVFESGS